jgi:hypothetical protein
MIIKNFMVQVPVNIFVVVTDAAAKKLECLTQTSLFLVGLTLANKAGTYSYAPS